jgi:site-specific DNA recombinase
MPRPRASPELDALDTELHDAESYLKLADTLESFLGRLADGLDQLNLEDQQRILRLVVREVLIGGDDDTITIRHTVPTPTGPMTQVTFCVGAVTTPP